ncbi:MAG: hypothetical protein ACI835_001430 [Planctomycetota bacterium]|jgi:hypothetical protein
MQNRIIQLAIAMTLLLSSSCASMIHGSSGPINMRSSNAMLEGATVTVGGKTHAMPCTLDVEKSTKKVVFNHPNHASIPVVIDRDFMSGMLVLDVLFTPGFGLVGILIDGPSGAWYELPKQIEINFDDGSVIQDSIRSEPVPASATHGDAAIVDASSSKKPARPKNPRNRRPGR